MEKARRHEAKQMSAIETSQDQVKRTTDQAALWEKEMQQNVGDTTATEGAMVSAVQKDVQGEEDSTSSASTKAVAAAEAQLRGVETKFETQMNRGSAQAGRDLAGTLGEIESTTSAVKQQLQGAMQAESTKVDDVIQGELPKMNALTKKSGQFSADVAGYADTVQKQRNELRKFNSEVQYHLDALQDEDELGEKFGDEMKAAVAGKFQTAANSTHGSSLAEDPSAVLDDIESRLDDDSALDQ